MVSISFKYKENNVVFNGQNSVEIFKDICDWLYENGYNFRSESTNSRSIYTKRQIEENNYPISRFYKISGSNFYIPTTMTGNISVRVKNMILMLKNFGIDEKSIQTNGLPIQTTSRIKKFVDIDNNEDNEDLDFEKDLGIEDPIEKTYSQNPFMQAICVLGESGAGKSTTVENILESEGHEFEFIIPSASTTGLLSQFSPSKSGYVPSKLGKMITKAYDNPTQLFTAVFDECHKSNVIEMINDELLQAISTKRNNGKRFISLDDDTAELYPNSEKYRGNILIPDNLGFIFISSKPDVILHNDDFFNRIDIVMLKPYKEENLTSINQLKVLSEEEKNSLKSNND